MGNDVKKYKMHIGHHNQFRAWENERASKNRPRLSKRWFSIEELREFNQAFKNMPDDWEPIVARNYQDFVDLVTPWSPIYFVWFSAESENEEDWKEDE